MADSFIHLHGKTALVTGGSRGVGRAVAVMLARAGARVGITYRTRQNEADRTLQQMAAVGPQGWAVAADFSSEAAIDPLFARVDTEFPDGLDILIANAGIWPTDNIPVTDMSSEHWRRTLAVNLDAVFYLTRAAGQRLRDHGRIVYVGSTAGQRGEANHVDYAASKGALISMVKGLGVEFGQRGITVNCVAPGWIDTDMVAPVFADGGKQRYEADIPLRRVASADDIAGPILFLCSDLARHITGEVLNVNGGAVLCG